MPGIYKKATMSLQSLVACLRVNERDFTDIRWNRVRVETSKFENKNEIVTEHVSRANVIEMEHHKKSRLSYLH